MKQMTEKEIIIETVKYYQGNSRGKDGTNCTYLSDAGCMCAVGRVMTPDALKEYANLIGDVDEVFNRMYDSYHYLEYDEEGVRERNEDVFDNSLQEKYRGHSRGFWIDLQEFHDSDRFWKELEVGNKLTESGLKYLRNYGVEEEDLV